MKFAGLSLLVACALEACAAFVTLKDQRSGQVSRESPPVVEEKVEHAAREPVLGGTPPPKGSVVKAAGDILRSQRRKNNLRKVDPDDDVPESEKTRRRAEQEYQDTLREAGKQVGAAAKVGVEADRLRDDLQRTLEAAGLDWPEGYDHVDVADWTAGGDRYSGGGRSQMQPSHEGGFGIQERTWSSTSTWTLMASPLLAASQSTRRSQSTRATLPVCPECLWHLLPYYALLQFLKTMFRSFRQ